MHISTLSLFPEMFNALRYGIVGKAQTCGLLKLQHWNIRDFANNKHNAVDDRPFGGGPGMVIMAKPVMDAIELIKAQSPSPCTVVYLTPQGQSFNQRLASDTVHSGRNLILLAGRYEGIDERAIESSVDQEWSMGDYVLSGGEIAAMAAIDCLTRLIPGALGHEESAQQDSFSNGLLDYPHFTRPDQLAGKEVPEVLLSGDHQAIMQWRLQQALGRTWLRRKDLLDKRSLSSDEQQLLETFIRDYQARGSKNE